MDVWFFYINLDRYYTDLFLFFLFGETRIFSLYFNRYRLPSSIFRLKYPKSRDVESMSKSRDIYVTSFWYFFYLKWKKNPNIIRLILQIDNGYLKGNQHTTEEVLFLNISQSNRVVSSLAIISSQLTPPV